MKRKEGFADLIFRGAGPSRLQLAAYALGVLASGILGEFLYQFLTDVLPATGILMRGALSLLLMGALPPVSVPLGMFFLAQALVETVQLLSAGQLIALAAILALYLAGYVLYRLDQRQARSAHTTFDESRLAPPHQGVIWIFGPGSFDHLLFALRHHVEGGGGQHCWLIMQKENRAVEAQFVDLERRLQEEGLPTILHPERIQDVDAQSAYRAVRSIYEEKATKAGVPADQLIADITGGLKPLTAGMVLAAMTTGLKLEYVESERDIHGEPRPNLHVVLLDTHFYLQREK
jgi:hypothetical protein